MVLSVNMNNTELKENGSIVETKLTTVSNYGTQRMFISLILTCEQSTSNLKNVGIYKL